MTRIAADWLTSAASRAVCAALAAQGHGAWFVGGCVRNALLGAPVSDLDIATDARPEQTLAAAEAAGLRAVPTGIDHGTVTVVSGGLPYEVTTFRRDVETDGRRAVVAFTTSMDEDARRRDFTMNALYAAPEGEVLDPLGQGLDDLSRRHIRFIEDPARRIAEDHLRILRFFRFFAWYGDPGAGIDAEGLAACAEGVEGLSRLSAERVTAEMLRLLGAPHPAHALAEMAAAGVLARVLPGADVAHLPALERLEAAADLPPRWLRRLLVTGGDSGGWRLSNAERRALEAAERALAAPEAPAARGHLLGEEVAADVLLAEAARTGAILAEDALAEVARGAAAAFPLGAADLMPPYTPGVALGTELARLRALWLADGLRMDRAALLAQARPPA